MKFLAFLSAVALFGHASAFRGQMAASEYELNEGGSWQDITLSDYTTGSTYKGSLRGGFDACNTDIDFCTSVFYKTSEGGYSFEATLWRTDDGCHNIDFKGALNAQHGYCCGSLPCSFTA